MASIKDVAKLAGVGVGTVSRTINGTGYVSEDTKKKITAAMEKLDYTPNELARNLYKKKSGIIAVLVPSVAHSFFAEFLNSIEIEFYEHGYKTMICNTMKGRSYEAEYLQMLKKRIVDGIVITGVHSLELQEYLNIDMPVVSLDRYIGGHIPVVSVNHRKGGQVAAQELLRCGCKKVVQIRGAVQKGLTANDRHEAFEEELCAAGVEVYTYKMEFNKFDLEYFRTYAENAFLEHPEADGMFGADLSVLSYMKTALAHGKRIPEDLRLVAYDGTQVTEMVYPSLTTVKQPIGQLAKEAAGLLIQKINGIDHQGKIIELEAALCRGDSTRV